MEELEIWLYKFTGHRRSQAML